MKTANFFFFITILILFNAACSSHQKIAESTDTDTKQKNEQQVWENGITTVNGKITKVNHEKDGQTIFLTDSNGTTYSAVISIPNLAEKANQYRNFEVGEEVGFRGNLIGPTQLVVREVLENK